MSFGGDRALLGSVTGSADGGYRRIGPVELQPSCGHPQESSSSKQRCWTVRWAALAALATLSAFVIFFHVQKAGREPDRQLMTAGVVDIQHGNGRLGNNVHQLVYGLYLAEVVGAERARLVSYGWSDQTDVLFDIPNEIPVDKAVLSQDMRNSSTSPRQQASWPCRPGDPGVPRSCREAADLACRKDGHYSSSFWFTVRPSPICEGIAAREYHGIAQAYLKPMFKAELSECLANHSGADEEEMLTIHMRGEDLWPGDEGDLDKPARNWAWRQPPCSMYEAIITEGHFKHVLVVTSPDRRNPCAEWFENANVRGMADIRVQSSTLLQDACALISATHLVTSYSTFPVAMAMLSTRLRRVYARDRFRNLLESPPYWEGIQAFTYRVPITIHLHSPYNSTYRGLNHFLLTYPVGEINETNATL